MARQNVAKSRFTRQLPVLIVALLCLAASLAVWRTARAAGIVHVVPGGTGLQNGTDWDNAKDLAAALANATSGDELWVKSGTYKPTTTNSDPRTATFALKNGVALYGGFAGNETARNQRNPNPATNGTVLSGDLNGDDAGFTNNGENSYHVVTVRVGPDSSARLDGFTIRGGNANGTSFPNDSGGGMYNFQSHPTLTNVSFSGNSASVYGGGMYNLSQSHPTLTNVSFSGNFANIGGGMYNNSDSSPTLTNVSFSGNSANSGGGMYNDNNSSPTLTNVSFSANSANFGGGGMYNVSSSSPTLRNCILWGDSGGEIANGSSNPTVSYSIVQGSGGSANWNTNFGTNGGHNLDTDPKFLTSNTGGDLRPGPGSPAIDAGTDCVLTNTCPGQNASFNLTFDLRGLPRPVGAHVDMGAYEVNYALAASGGNNQSSAPNTAFLNPLQATLTESAAPVSGVQLTFSANPVSGASATLGTPNPATTNASGQASVSAQANGFTGSYTVTANTTPGLATPASFRLTNNSAPTVTQLALGGASLTNLRSVTFNLSFSEPVTDAMAGNFTLVPGGGVTGAMITGVVCTMAAQSCVITVNTGTGDGTLGLDMTSSTGVTDSDGAGLSNLPFTGQVYTIDQSAPDMPNVDTPANGSFTNNPKPPITGRAEAGSTVSVFIDCLFPCPAAGTAPVNGSGNWTFTPSSNLSDGSHRVKARTTDAAGNDSSASLINTFTVDTQPPTVTINQASGQADPTSSSTINFTVVFSEAVTGFANVDVTLSGTAGATTAAVAEIAPNNGTTYNVAVTGMTTGGTVIAVVRVNAAQDAAGNNSAASTSTDNTVTYLVCPTQFTVNHLGDTPDTLSGNGVCADSNGHCTLRAALQEANALAACTPLTINFDVTGTITLTGSELTISHPNLTLQGPGAHLLTVSGNMRSRVFTINSGARVTLDALTIANGKVSSANFSEGGGIHNSGTLTISNSTLSGNFASSNASVFGGGIINIGDLTISNSTLSGNSASGGGSSSNGGGIYNLNGTVNLTNSTLSGNSASSNITANYGGGIYNNRGTVNLTNSTLSGNFASGGSPILGGGIYNNNGIVNTRNTIIAGNTVSGGSSNQGPDVFGPLTSQGNNLIGNNAAATITPTTGDQIGTPTNPINPLLALLGNYGGPTQTHALLPGSPALNAGNNCVLTANGCGNNNPALTTDQRGFTRQTAVVDIGAYESRGFTLAVSSGDNQNTALNTAFANPLLVTVSSNVNEPVQGGVISFSAPGSGASAMLSNPATLNASGQTSVNATANNVPGAYQVTAGAHGLTSVSFNLSNACQVITVLSPATATGTAGAAFNQTFTQTGGNGATAFSLQSGVLPTGLAFNPSGVLSGTPVQTGTFALTVKATDANGCTGMANYTLVISCPALTFAPATLNGGQVGAAYSQQLSVTGAFGNSAAFSVSAGALPNGLRLSSAGLLSGTPSANGTFSFTVRAQDSLGCFGERPYTLNIGCTALVITPATLPNAQAGVAFNQPLAANGVAPQSFSLLNTPAPPAWLAINSGGVLSGTPPAPGNFNFAVSVSDAQACTGTRSYTLSVGCPTFTLAALPTATAGAAYTANLNASPAGGNYQFSSTDKPAWLTIASNGALSGTPPTAGTVNFNVSVTGFGSCTQTLAVTLTVACPALTVNPVTLPNANLGAAYTQTLTATPGSGHTFNVTTGALPGGLTLNANGTLSGTPTAAGTFSFTVTAAAFGTCAGTRAYSLTVTSTCSTITVNPTTLPGGTLGTAYNQTVSASPAGTYTFSVVSGTLPTGLTLDANTGAISGTPTAGGTFTPTIKATAGSCSGQRLYVISVTCATVTITTTTLPNAALGVAYSQQLTANVAGTYSLLLGSLPAGFNLSSTGLLSGTTTQAGSYNLTVKLTAGSCSGMRAYTLVVGGSMAALALQGDYDGDGKSDLALWSNTGTWRIVNSGAQQTQPPSWGTAGDVSLLGDYDGDGKTDLAVFRPSNGTWYIKRSSDGGTLTRAWGAGYAPYFDVPVPGDYDGDGKTDLAVWRGADSNWYIVRSSDGMIETTAWGASYAPYYDVAVPGDYDGDGKTDLAVFRRATGTWFIKRSSDSQVTVKAWGLGSDVPVAADYDGDGKTDIAVWRGSEGVWYIWQSATQSARAQAWGAGYDPYRDLAAPGDYDGDGQADLAIWRSAEQTWLIRCSAQTTPVSTAQGLRGDRPVTAAGR